jgi:hypothetical protein
MGLTRQGATTQPTAAKHDSNLSWAADHAPLLGSMLLFVLVVVRVMRVAAFDPATAAALVRESGTLEIVLGVLVTSFPPLLLGGIVCLLMLAVVNRESGSVRDLAFGAALAGLLLLTVVLPWTSLIAYSIALVAVIVLARLLQWSGEFIVLLMSVVLIVLTVSEVWLPPEEILLEGGTDTVGYVLSVEPEWTTILEEADRSILLVPSEDVISRKVCNLESQSEAPTIWQASLGEEGGIRNPECPAEAAGNAKPEST